MRVLCSFLPALFLVFFRLRTCSDIKTNAAATATCARSDRSQIRTIKSLSFAKSIFASFVQKSVTSRRLKKRNKIKNSNRQRVVNKRIIRKPNQLVNCNDKKYFQSKIKLHLSRTYTNTLNQTLYCAQIFKCLLSKQKIGLIELAFSNVFN